MKPHILSTDWKLERIDSISQAILSALAFKLTEQCDVLAKVVIEEYVDVVHAFFQSSERRMAQCLLAAAWYGSFR
ncbi:MAG: transcription antitermination factor NusB [Rhizomicrobium sp.]